MCVYSHELSRNKVRWELAYEAKELAKELKTRCDYEEDYTYEEYLKDMERDNLYQEVNNRIKKE